MFSTVALMVWVNGSRTAEISQMITPEAGGGRPSKKDCRYLADSEQSVRKTGRVCKLSQYHPNGRGRTGIFLLMRNPLQEGS
jgi:hypothetical protein